MNIHIYIRSCFFASFFLIHVSFCADPVDLGERQKSVKIRVNNPYSCSVIDPKQLEGSEVYDQRLSSVLIASIDRNLRVWYAGPDQSWWHPCSGLIFVRDCHGNSGVLDVYKNFYVWNALENRWIFSFVLKP